MNKLYKILSATIFAMNITCSNTEINLSENKDQQIEIKENNIEVPFMSFDEFANERISLSYPETIREISKACLESKKTGEETGGIVTSNARYTGIEDRLKFIMIENITNEYSEARKAVDSSKDLKLKDLKSDLSRYMEGNCNMYDTDPGWKTNIDEVLREIDYAEKHSSTKNKRRHIARDVLEITNSTYKMKPITITETTVALFHVHPNGSSFSLVDHCLFDNSKARDYVVACEADNFTVYRLKDKKNISLTTSPILKD